MGNATYSCSLPGASPPLRAPDPSQSLERPGYEGWPHLISGYLCVSGKVIANRTVDYEEVHWLNFTVRASDNGSPPRAAEIPVYLEIVDINDNNPIFDQPSYQVGGQTNVRVRTCTYSLGSLVCLSLLLALPP